ncbi:MAG: thiamine-phosphate kinase [Verrucomicrobiota bacterium]
MKRTRRVVGEIGEFTLIDRIRRILPVSGNKDLIVDIGDDTAVVRIDDRRALLLTCDIQVENRHFRLDRTTPYRLGRRAMAVNLSDIASMGGRPTYALVSLGLPARFPVDSFDRLFEGMRDEMLPHGAYVIGGNLAQTARELIVDVTLVGEVPLSRVLTRSGARPGDRIFVTGTLGASGAGFHAMQRFGNKVPRKYRDLVARHVLPSPRVALGQRISAAGVASAMIDLSDGVASDLFHVCTRSGVGAEIHEGRLPLPRHIGEIAKASGKPVLDLALHCGEDYELLFTVPPEVSGRKIRNLPGDTGVPVTEIGTIIGPGEGYWVVDSRGNRSPLKPVGWDHFHGASG